MEMQSPDWIKTGTVTLKFTELNATTVGEIIECLTDQNEMDPRIPRLKLLWDMLTNS